MIARIFKRYKYWSFAKGLRKGKNHISPDSCIAKSSKISESTAIGKVNVGERCIIHGAFISGQVSISDNTSLWGPGIHVIAHINPITIGKFCSIAHGVTIQEYNHDPSRVTSYFIQKNVFGENMVKDIVSKGGIQIGNDVWIGAKATILSGVTIGTGAVIGANCVIAKDVPPYAIMVGNPAKLLRYRFDEKIVNMLLAEKWWNWSIEEIKSKRAFFVEPPSA